MPNAQLNSINRSSECAAVLPGIWNATWPTMCHAVQLYTHRAAHQYAQLDGGLLRPAGLI